MSYSPTPHSSGLHPSGRSRVATRPPVQKHPAPQTTARKAVARKRPIRKRPAQRVVWAGGSVATLALLVILPGRGGSQSVAQADCLEVVRSGAEISRGQLSQLLSLPVGSSKAAIRQVTDAPYCVLPVAPSADKADEKNPNPVAEAAEREAYPLAFDPQAWVVIGYEADEYVGYDFVFKQ